MDNQKLFTVRILGMKNPQEGQESESRELDRFPKMLNAGIIQGKMVELEHSRLVGPSVKFKTVVNYDQFLDTDETLGLTLTHQQTTTRPNNNSS